MDQKNKLSFKCKNCKEYVSYEAYGTKNRNHCPNCLYSLHVDEEVGDRKSGCGGLMPAISKMLKKDGEEVLLHKCEKCGIERKNRVAGNDNVGLVEALEEIEFF